MRGKKPAATAAAVVVVLVAAIVVVVRVAAGDEPDDVVRAFLEAARRGDVAAAVRAAGGADPPTGPSAVLLTADVPPLAWQVGAVSKPYNVFGGEAEVDATVTDGTVSGRGRYQLRERDGRWHIDEPFVTLRFGESAVRALQINGRWFAVSGDQQVLPGVYEPVGTTIDLVQASGARRVVALPSTAGEPLAFPQTAVPTAKARRYFQDDSDKYLGRCLTDPACGPVSERYRPAGGEPVEPSELRRATWRVVRPPKVDLPGTVRRAPDGRVVFAGQVTVPGILRVDGVTATGTFTTTCIVPKLPLDAYVSDRGLLQPVWTGSRPRIEADCDNRD